MGTKRLSACGFQMSSVSLTPLKNWNQRHRGASNRKALKASRGSLLRTPLARLEAQRSLQTFWKKLKTRLNLLSCETPAF